MQTCRIEITVSFDDPVDRSQILQDIGNALFENHGARVSVSKIMDERSITSVRRRDDVEEEVPQ